MHNDKDTFYAMKMHLELSQCYLACQLRDQAEEALATAERICTDVFGGPESPLYLCYYLRKIEVGVNIATTEREKLKKWEAMMEE